jgi:hypothetical protein
MTTQEAEDLMSMLRGHHSPSPPRVSPASVPVSYAPSSNIPLSIGKTDNSQRGKNGGNKYKRKSKRNRMSRRTRRKSNKRHTKRRRY